MRADRDMEGHRYGDTQADGDMEGHVMWGHMVGMGDMGQNDQMGIRKDVEGYEYEER